MTKFQIKFRGRLKGAIGIFEDFTETVEASDRDAAVLKLYDKYEHISVGKIEEVTRGGAPKLCEVAP